MSDSATEVLTAVLSATQAAWAACERGEAELEDIHAVLLARRELLARLDGAVAFTPSERELAGNLRALDSRLNASRLRTMSPQRPASESTSSRMRSVSRAASGAGARPPSAANCRRSTRA